MQGAFTGGGNNQGTVRDNQDHYELQNYTTAAKGRHAINFGARLRLTRDASYSTSGFNGNYIYPSLSAYAAGTPSEYDVTSGNAAAGVNLFDAGLFFQDDYKARPNLTLSYGLRYESQNRIGDHADWAPRFSLAWAPAGGNNGHPAKTVIRAGYGWFYDRFSSTYVLDAIRQNGINQQQYVVKNPSFTANAPLPSQLASTSAVAPTIYQVAPNLKASVNMQAAIGVEHQFGKIATASATYINSHGVHQYLSDNINAYLPGTYDAATGTGVRPNGINENIYQFQSGGIYNQNQLMFNYSVRATPCLALRLLHAELRQGRYLRRHLLPLESVRSPCRLRPRHLRRPQSLPARRQSPGALRSFPQPDARAQFRPALQHHHRSGPERRQPVQRPSLLCHRGQHRYHYHQLRNLRSRSIGRSGAHSLQRRQRPIAIQHESARQQVHRHRAARGTLRRIRCGSWRRRSTSRRWPSRWPGWWSRRRPRPRRTQRVGGPPRLDQELPRRYSLTFSAMARNVFNSVNLAQPVGVLDSPLFGKSNALSGGFFSSPASNRSIDLQVSFSF